ncbi:MAG: asparagine synthase-related protein [Pseudomonadota bacterium]
MIAQDKDGYAYVFLFKKQDGNRSGVADELCCAYDSSNLAKERQNGLAYLSYSTKIGEKGDNGAQSLITFNNMSIIGSFGLIDTLRLRKALGNNTSSENVYVANCLLVIQAYLKWGVAFTEYLNGSFSFAILDFVTRELLAVRDHIGIKQFYFWFGCNRLAFSDSLGGLQKVVGKSSSFDREFIDDYMLLKFPTRSSTIFSDFKSLPPAHILVANREKYSITQYWDFKQPLNIKASDDADSRLNEIVKNSIVKRTNNNNSIAIQLSGGLDSSSVLALMSKMLGSEQALEWRLFAITRTFKKEFRDKKRDERRFAEEIARQCSISLYCSDDEIVAPLEHLSEYYALMGNIPYNPFFAISNPSFKASQVLGAKTLVTGIGGDEIASMSGQNVYPLLCKKMQYIKLMQGLVRYSKVYDSSLWKSLKLNVIRPLLPLFMRKIYNDIYYPGRRSEEEISFLHQDYRQESENKRRYSQGIYFSDSFDISSEISRNVYNGMMQHVLETYSYASIRYGIDFVHPLLDKDIMTFISQVDPFELIKDGWRRSLFRRSMLGYLPESIRCRKTKSIFSLPYEKYIQASNELIFDLLDSRNCMAWDYIDVERLKNWVTRVCSKSRAIKNVDLMALKIGMAVNVAFFIEYNAQEQRNQ